jgi:hypothetical protein
MVNAMAYRASGSETGNGPRRLGTSPALGKAARGLALAAMAALFPLFSGVMAAAQGPPPQLELTDREKAFIEAHPVVTFSDSIWEPLAVVENGTYQGVFHDFFRIVSAMTGLAFKFEPQGDSRNFGKVLAALRDKRIDMIDGTGKTADREKYALFAGPFLRFPLAIVSRDDVMSGSFFELQGSGWPWPAAPRPTNTPGTTIPAWTCWWWRTPRRPSWPWPRGRPRP